MDAKLAERVNQWLAWDKNEQTRAEIEQLVSQNNIVELRLRMEGELSFGTAGVRTRMAAGFTRLNDLTILQLSHGMAQVLLNEKFGDDNKEQPKSVVVGYDGRHNSKRFAQLASNVFVLNGIRVHLFSDYVPTPVVSFAVVALKCHAGLMITASHNPKEDNGYKAYWSNGAQILAPHDKQICQLAREQPQPRDAYWQLPMEVDCSQLLCSADPVLEQYFHDEARLCCFYRDLNAKSPLRLTYSAFHGVGSKFVRRMFAEFGFPAGNISYVKEQDEPDPDFPTVPFPNPEEGRRVLELCFQTADANQARLVLANDPDADRLQMAEKQPNGEWRVFTGNEMGALLTWWMWAQWRQRNPRADASQVYVLNSAVSSQIVATMAKQEGFKNATALTGFKWIGNLAEKLRNDGKTIILSWEESIGFTTGSTLDKDGVSAAAVFAEMANWLSLQPEPLSLSQQLLRIYHRYGFHLCRNSYVHVTRPESTGKLFADLRAEQQYPNQLGGVDIAFVRDLTTGYDNSQPDNRAVLPLSASSPMVTFTLATGSVVTLRASGTEPKLKYYIELRTEPGKTEKDLVEVQKSLDQLERDVVNELLKPQLYGFKSRD